MELPPGDISHGLLFYFSIPNKSKIKAYSKAMSFR
jgi:hypothetical protein